MRKISFMFAIIFSSCLLIAQVAYCQTNEETSGSGDAVQGKARGEDPNIEERKAKNDPNQTDEDIVQPADKGGRTRGTVCAVVFDNYTSWYIDCYVDAKYRGDVAPYGDGKVYVAGGDTQIYAVAEFTDGSEITYGPLTRYCSNRVFEVTLYKDYYNYRVY